MHSPVDIVLSASSIAEVACDVIVNAANPWLGGIGRDLSKQVGGVDGAVHRAAGLGLLDECEALPRFDGITHGRLEKIRCAHGDIRITAAYALPCRHVIHAVAPLHEGGGRKELLVLEVLYDRIFVTLRALGLSHIALPALGTGSFGMPPEESARVAVAAALQGGAGTKITFCLPGAEDRAAYERALAATGR